VREIQLMHPDEFRTVVPVLGNFHLVKLVLKCIRKAIDGSGADTTWLQADVHIMRPMWNWCTYVYHQIAGGLGPGLNL
jgi:hypothetical protein